MTEREPSRRAANWHNPTWTLAVMHFPDETDLLAAISAGTESILTNRNAWRADTAATAKAGIVAGHVLSVLYALAVSPWRIAEPSLEKAIHVAERFAYQSKFADGSPMPRGRTDIRKSFDAMRPVAHLWAALRLHRQYPICRHEDLMRTVEGIERLLRIARGVQQWASEWQPPRASRAAPLLGDDPWLIPGDVQPLLCPWADKPDWLLSTLANYKRRSR